MKKTIILTLAAALFFCVGLNAQEIPWDIEWNDSTWIGSLPDSVYVCSLSIPGSHDSCTKNVYGSTWAKTQIYSVEEQFKRGVRVFDIRPAIQSEYIITSDNPDLYIYHGIMSCGIKYDEVLTSFEMLLEQFPQEFIIMIANIEDNHSPYFTNDDTRAMLLERERGYIGKKFFVQEFRPDLTVGDMRGKILIINRDDLGSTGDSPVPAAFFNGWSSKPTMGTLSHGARMNKGGTNLCTFYDQDVDHYSDEDDWYESKFQYFEQAAEMYYADEDYFTWCFNCASGWVGWTAASMDYNENADKVNGYLSDTYLFFNQKFSRRGAWRGVGIVLMDFAGCHEYDGHTVYGDDLVHMLIHLNFKRLSTSPYNH